MTQAQMIELVQQHHPNSGETELRLAFNRAQDDFCAKSEIIKDTFTQSSVAGQRYYTLDPLILKVTSVQVNDVKIPRLIGNPIIDDDEFDAAEGLTVGSPSSNDRYWYIDNGRLGVVEKGTTSRDGQTSNYQSISEIKELRLFAIARGADFTADLTETSAIPIEFHDALIYKAISDGYLKGDFNPQASQLYDGRYRELVKDAKKQARSNYTGGVSIITPTDF